MMIVSLAEVISIGSVLPFLGILTAPEHVYQHDLMKPAIQFLNLQDSSQLILPVTVLFMVAAVFSVSVRLVFLYVSTRLSYAAGADISIDIYRRTLYQDYSVHLNQNSSEVINSVITKTNTVIGGVLRPVLTLISSFVIMISIVAILLTIDIMVAIVSFSCFSIFYWLVIRYTHNQVKSNGKCIADNSTQMIKTLQEGLGGIRDVLIDGSQQYYADLYRSADLPLRRASGDNIFISTSPRYVLEGVGMILITILAYTMIQEEDGIMKVVPVLGALALGAQRLLPSLQLAYGAYVSIKGAQYVLKDVLLMLDQPVPNYINSLSLTPISFEKSITLSDVDFQYSESDSLVLEHLDLEIVKGMRVGFIGKTGSGKSTLLDIVMGLLLPTKGNLKIDGQQITKENCRSWQIHIAHVPQSIYLSDDTIEKNIAFGVSEENIDHTLVRKVARQAKIEEFIENWDNKYQTIIGERGVRLSGGQQQRIGIARALYKQANVIIFDEATSALDNITEQDVMKAVDSLGKDLTILIIAHRLTTLKKCDQIIELTDNGVNVGTYNELIKNRIEE